MQQRILILMSDTGGGHRASAQALKAGFDELYVDRFHIDIIDLISDYLPWPINQTPKAYPFLSNRATWMWKLLYSTDSPLDIGPWLARFGGRVAVPSIVRVIKQYDPALIISVHPLFQSPCLWALQKMERRIPFVTVVTDLSTAHPAWLNPGVDACYVASDFTLQLAIRCGVPRAKLHLFGLPIRPSFAQPARPRPLLRAMLGMDVDLPALLLVGGGEGVGPVEEIAERTAHALAAQSSAQGQIVVICGRNRALKERLQARSWPAPVIVKAFVDNMQDWMAACNCVVTKAGPGTIAEALISGLPIILSGFIPGQEEGNVPFVVDNGVGIYSTDPQEIAATVVRWFGSQRAQLDAMSAQARALGHPRATYDIVRSIVQLLP